MLRRCNLVKSRLALWARAKTWSGSVFAQAANYALEREMQLRVFLADPAVPVDTNDLERAIRPIAVGKK